MIINSVPVVNLPFSYINGLQLSYTSATTVTVAAGQCRDSSNQFDITLGASTVIDAGVNGVNGLDTGSLANSTLYYVYIISDSRSFNTPKLLLSTSATAPYVPAGYDILRRIGSVRTDGSAHFLKFYQSGSASQRKYTWDAPISVLSGGNSTTFAAVDLSGAVPALANCRVGIISSFTPATAANAATIRPSGSAATTGVTITGVVAAKAQGAQEEVLALLISGVPKIDYIVAAAGDALSLSVISFIESL